MKKVKEKPIEDEMRPEYDFSKMKGVRGKYAGRFKAGAKLVLLAPDVAEQFPDEKAVNAALRAAAKLSKMAKARAR